MIHASRYSASSEGSYRRKSYMSSSLPVTANLSRVGFYFFTIVSFLICLLMILYHSRTFDFSFFVKNTVMGETNEMEANEHKFSSVLYGLGFGIDFLFLIFYYIQQRVTKPKLRPHKYYILYLGITFLFFCYFLTIVLLFSLRTFNWIDKPISEDFLLNFALFSTHVLCMTLSAAMKTIEFRLIDKCTRKNDLFFLDPNWLQTPVLENGGAQQPKNDFEHPRFSLAEQRGSFLVMYS